MRYFFFRTILIKNPDLTIYGFRMRGVRNLIFVGEDANNGDQQLASPPTVRANL